jgi:hypothetical protein
LSARGRARARVRRASLAAEAPFVSFLIWQAADIEVTLRWMMRRRGGARLLLANNHQRRRTLSCKRLTSREDPRLVLVPVLALVLGLALCVLRPRRRLLLLLLRCDGCAQ